MYKHSELRVGDIVAFNDLPDCAWFEIVAIKGFVLIVRETGTDYATQRMDRSLVKQVRVS